MKLQIIPDNFYSDPLGYGGNQSGHIMIGVTAIYWMAYAWLYATGGLPPAWALALAWALMYLALEFSQKGGFAWDKREDIAVSIIYPVLAMKCLSEFKGITEKLVMAFMPFFAFYAIHIGLVGVGIRLRQAITQGRGL